MLRLSGGVPAHAAGIEAGYGVAYAVVAGASALLAYFPFGYARDVLAAPYRERWGGLAVAVAAAGVYGLSGIAAVGGVDAARPFADGATVFVLLFSALSLRTIRGVVEERGGGRAGRPRLRHLGVGLAVAGWWIAYLFGGGRALAAVEAVVLAAAVGYALGHAVPAVTAAEGTSVAAVVRQFVPAVVVLAVAVVAERGLRAAGDPALATAVELVGAALLGGFLFATAVAIRQQGGELRRLYDPTTCGDQPATERRPTRAATGTAAAGTAAAVPGTDPHESLEASENAVGAVQSSETSIAGATSRADAGTAVAIR